MKRYTFRQNNSGGYWIGPHYFVCLAQDGKSAWKILKDQPWYTDEHCTCCGHRWYEDLLDWETDPDTVNEGLISMDLFRDEVIYLTKEQANG